MIPFEVAQSAIAFLGATANGLVFEFGCGDYILYFNLTTIL
jgi:hypothetical protein